MGRNQGRGVRGATRLGPLISAVGASIFLQNAVMLTQGARMKVYMTNLVFPRTWRFNIFGLNVSVLLIVMASVSLLLMWALIVLVQRTTLGRSIRAVSEDREMATVMGSMSAAWCLTFFLGSALGGAAGVLIGPTHADRLRDGLLAGLKAFAAVLAALAT
jgi:branched-chain amino acid transport system permease protein